MQRCIRRRIIGINETDQYGETPLMKAAIHQSIGVLRFLIRSNAELEAVNNKGQTALHIAVAYDRGSTECIQALLDARANKEARTGIHGDTPLAFACRLDKEEAAILLIDYKTNVEGASGNETPLMLAAANGNFKVVKSLIVSRANIDARDTRGRTALHHAARGGFDDCVDVLISQMADKNAVTYSGLTPLCMAAMYGRYHAVCSLLYNRVDVNN